MSDSATVQDPVPEGTPSTGGHDNGHGGASRTALAVGAIGVVFGDIGTSPLYAFRETFSGAANIAIDRMHVLGVVSLIFWSMLIVVAIQYVTILMRADNKGQGGSLALIALISRHIGQTKYAWLVVLLGVFGGILAFGFMGLFLGPTLLAVAFSLLGDWVGNMPPETALATVTINAARELHSVTSGPHR
jgi:KUP system potassium uptake protein